MIKSVKPSAHGAYIELKDPEHALDKIAQAKGFFVNKHEHSGPDGRDIEVIVTYGRGE
jgi:hypothetical protein